MAIYLAGLILFVGLSISYFGDENEQCENTESELLAVIFGHIVAVSVIYASLVSICLGGFVYGIVRSC